MVFWRPKYFHDLPRPSGIIFALVDAQNGGLASIFDIFCLFGTNFGQLESPNSELGGAPGPGGVTLGIWAWEVNNLL